MQISTEEFEKLVSIFDRARVDGIQRGRYQAQQDAETKAQIGELVGALKSFLEMDVVVDTDSRVSAASALVARHEEG